MTTATAQVSISSFAAPASSGSVGKNAPKGIDALSDILAAASSTTTGAAINQAPLTQSSDNSDTNTDAISTQSVNLKSNPVLSPATSAALSDTTTTTPDTSTIVPPQPTSTTQESVAPAEAPQALAPTALSQGIVVQTAAYSSVASASSSTIRGSGVNVLS